MDREPKISEIEKLIEHFRQTGREDELLDVLKEHGIVNDEPLTPVLDKETGEFHEEGIVLNKLAQKEGFLKKRTIRNYFQNFKENYHHKWYFRYALYYLCIFVVIFAILNAPIFFSRYFGSSGKSQIITTQELESQPMAESAPLDPGEVIPASNQVIIPKINVTAPIIFIETRDEATIQNYLTQGVVHYAGTAKPGEVGNSFITGHSSNFWWIRGDYNYIFVNLDKLQIGDQAKIYYNGKKFVYTVRDKKVVLPTDTSVLATTDTPVLTLMTCTPPGTNWKRLIVTLDQVAPKYEKPKVVTKQIVVNPNSLPSTDTNSIGALWEKFISWAAGILGFNN